MEERLYLVLNKQKIDVKYWAIEKTATWGEQGKWGIIEILTKNPKKKPQQKKDARLGFLLLRTFIIYTVWETGHMTHLLNARSAHTPADSPAFLIAPLRGVASV